MNECKATADIVELMSRIVIVVDCSDEGQKRSGQQLTAKKRGISNGNTKRSMTVSRFFA